ncbi:uncharacterized protein EDB91DRAFT_1254140 [Suillus paluster]|uniref:uncharacterized protein n=1 Tax=Suillus paluster TaxID=48578 RepID=UPI001B85EE0B|nr:uncharacterized protein EDB91DRAFT_1254140 [Suillus paluster]KAG1726894.1 hypothetical protein EDB91DRAFT_1254140 [Suillus paluster]
MLPTHPFIHGIENMPLLLSTAPHHIHNFVPPPYSMHVPVHAPNPVPMQVNARPAQQPVVTSNITIFIPLNSGVVGGHMDLDPADAELGYKFHTNHAHDDPHQLSDKQQLHEALERGRQLIDHSHTQETILELHNLKRPHATTLSFTAEFHKLKNKLDCVKHPGKFCYINPISGDHKAQDIYNLTLWAKKIFLGKATYEKPPETAAFDHISKKHRVSSTTASQAGPSLPAIHSPSPSDNCYTATQ